MGGRAGSEESTLEVLAQQVGQVGLTPERVEDWTGTLRFTDVGAIVYYLKAIPWIVEGFSVDTHFDQLIRLQESIERTGDLEFVAREYLIQAQK